MKKIRGLDKWLTEDTQMLSWVWGELNKARAGISLNAGDQDLRGKLLNHLNALSQNIHNREIITKIRKDWSKKKFTDKPENQTVTFTLAPHSIKKLDHLSGKSSRREVLEILINYGSDIDKEMRSERREAIKREKERLECKWPKQRAPSLQLLKTADELEKLKATIQKQEEILTSTLLQISQYKVLTEAKNLTTTDLSDKQKEQAHDKFENMKKRISNEIKAAAYWI